MEARSLDPVERATMIYDGVRRSKAFLVRLHHVAKRMGVLDADARVNYGVLEKLAEAYRGTVVERETLREVVHDKLDLRALNEFLDHVREPVVVKVSKLTPLAEHVLGNPYMRGDVAVNIKSIALEQIIEAKKRYLEGREVLILCTLCGYTQVKRAGDIKGRLSCPKCGSSALAPLPNTDWGKAAAETYRKYLKEERLAEDEKRIVEEVRDRAGLYLNYATQNLGDYVVKALLTHGIGPKKAKKIMEALLKRGERAYYEELLKAEEEYITTRKYWKQ